MNYTENFDGIKLNVQAIDVALTKDLQRNIRKMIVKLKRHFPKITWIDFYFSKSMAQSIHPRKISARFGIPGPDVFASESGTNWKFLLKSVERKLRRQLKKRRAHSFQNAAGTFNNA